MVDLDPPVLRSVATNKPVSLVHLVELMLARGFGMAPALVCDQQSNHGAVVSGRPVGPKVSERNPSFDERLVEPGCQRQLAADFGAEIRRRLVIADALEQRRGEPRRHQEADELAAEAVRDVDADDEPSAVTAGPPLMPGLSAPVKWMRSL